MSKFPPAEEVFHSLNQISNRHNTHEDLVQSGSVPKITQPEGA